jgi:integrase
MPSIALTDLTVRSLKADQRTDFWDTKTPAFGIRIGKHTKTFVAKVGNRRITIGAYPEISLQEARKRALGFKATTRPEFRRSITFEAAYELFKTQHIAQKKARTQRDYKRIIDVHFLPTLRTKRVAEITSQNLHEITDRLSNRPAEKRHAIAVSRTFFQWCVRREYIDRNPLVNAQVPKSVARSRVLSDDELQAIWAACSGTFGTIVRLLILTGQRRGEIGALRPQYIGKGTITLPAQLCKNGREHTFPIGPMTSALLQPVMRDDGFLFPARGNPKGPFSGWSKCKNALDDLCKVKGWTLHDLRRTFATKLAEMGVAPHVIERLLNHVTGTISPIALVYNRARYVEEMRAAVDLWEAKISSLVQQKAAA